MVIGKRAQFFLLAAVIISAVVISLGISANRATVNREPESFYDFSYEVKREAGSVIDYEIYSEIDGNLEDFVGLLAEDIKDKNPDANFKFIYGNNTYLVERDFGDTGSGKKAPSRICFGTGECVPVSGSAKDHNPDAGKRVLNAYDIGGSDNFIVEVGGHEFSFPISRHKQVVFIMQKDVDDESFVTIG